MSEQENAIEADRHSAGRGDLQVPELQWDTGIDGMYNCLFFFKRFWEMQGADAGTYSYEGGSLKPRPHFFELEIPAQGDKPLAVVRSKFTARNEDDAEASRRQITDGIMIGVETHKVLVRPAEQEDLVPLFKLSRIHFIGEKDPLDPPMAVVWAGEQVDELSSFAPDNPALAVDERWLLAREGLDNRLKEILSDIKALLAA